jgi:hypothetical protein
MRGAAADIVPLAAARSRRWLPPGKTAAVCLSIDDLHPRASEYTDRPEGSYESGGDLRGGAIGRLIELQRHNPALKVTLAVTPDWRLDSLVPDTRVLRHVPWLRHHVRWARRCSRGRFRVDRHPQFVACLNGLERCEVVPHGLTHSHPGPNFAAEFQHQSRARCAAMIQKGLAIFHAAELRYTRGYIPPAWSAPPNLLAALETAGFRFVSAARDVKTPIRADAAAAMSGLTGVSLIYPQCIGKLVHITCNFQATSEFERARQILNLGGVLHVKAHIFKSGGGHTMLDGLDPNYCGYLNSLFGMLAREFGERLWWAHLSEIAERVLGCS